MCVWNETVPPSFHVIANAPGRNLKPLGTNALGMVCPVTYSNIDEQVQAEAVRRQHCDQFLLPIQKCERLRRWFINMEDRRLRCALLWPGKGTQGGGALYLGNKAL